MFGESVLTPVSHIEARRVRFDKGKDCIGLVEVLTAFLTPVSCLGGSWKFGETVLNSTEVEGGLQIFEESV